MQRRVFEDLREQGGEVGMGSKGEGRGVGCDCDRDPTVTLIERRGTQLRQPACTHNQANHILSPPPVPKKVNSASLLSLSHAGKLSRLRGCLSRYNHVVY